VDFSTSFEAGFSLCFIYILLRLRADSARAELHFFGGAYKLLAAPTAAVISSLMQQLHEAALESTPSCPCAYAELDVVLEILHIEQEHGR